MYLAKSLTLILFFKMGLSNLFQDHDPWLFMGVNLNENNVQIGHIFQNLLGKVDIKNLF